MVFNWSEAITGAYKSVQGASENWMDKKNSGSVGGANPTNAQEAPAKLSDSLGSATEQTQSQKQGFHSPELQKHYDDVRDKQRAEYRQQYGSGPGHRGPGSFGSSRTGGKGKDGLKRTDTSASAGADTNRRLEGRYKKPVGRVGGAQKPEYGSGPRPDNVRFRGGAGAQAMQTKAAKKTPRLSKAMRAKQGRIANLAARAAYKKKLQRNRKKTPRRTYSTSIRRA